MIDSIAIVGAGLAGVRSAEALRAEGFPGRISLVNGEGILPYDRPSLSKSVLLDPGSSPPPLVEANWFANAAVDLLDGEEAVSIDPPSGKVRLKSGLALAADRILLATGARPKSLPGSLEVEGMFSLRDYRDSRQLGKALKAAANVVIIGGGLIGCEVATAARKLGCNVTIVEALDELVIRALGPHVGIMCRDWLNDAGITTLTGVGVSQIVGDRHIEAVKLADGRILPADVALVSIGVEPETQLARHAMLPCQRNGVVVDATGATVADRVFAAGDVAAWPTREGAPRCLETYLNSQEQAGIAARAMLGIRVPSIQIPIAWTEIAGRYVQSIGSLNGEGELITREEGSGTIIFRLVNGRLEACVSIDAVRGFAIARRLAEARAPLDGAKLRDGQIALKDIARGLREVQNVTS